ncbi:hypothetical protein B7P43_G14069 [Cryptotermes secundus]|uniref:Uncharacterized protein n=1 Tax=Cryptotermes secundus TaxID=105785 RepID=A0A2J7RSB1_9NEOP|nr:hypothetical protein B7P43_G14069 [Cryptotermes secundus]
MALCCYPRSTVGDTEFTVLLVHVLNVSPCIAGKPSGFQAPSYKVYKYELSEGLSVIFEVEVRIIRRFLGPGYLYELNIERTDFLPQYWREREDSVSCRVTTNT